MRLYAIDHRRLRFIEFIRVARPHTIPAALLWVPLQLGLTRWQPQIIQRSVYTELASLSIGEVAENARPRCESIIAELDNCGCVEPIIECQHSNGPTGTPVTGVAIRARHSNGLHILQVLFAFTQDGANQIQYQLVTFQPHSRTSTTTNGSPTLDRIPGAAATYHPRASLHELIRIHETKLSDLHGDVIALRNNHDMFRELEGLSDRYFTHMVKRGVLTEIST